MLPTRARADVLLFKSPILVRFLYKPNRPKLTPRVVYIGAPPREGIIQRIVSHRLPLQPHPIPSRTLPIRFPRVPTLVCLAGLAITSQSSQVLAKCRGQRRVKSARGRTRTPHIGDLYQICLSRAGCQHIVLADATFHSCGKLIGTGKAVQVRDHARLPRL